MTDVATNLSTINGSLSDIKTAIVNKGVTPSGNITTYATAIGNISGGGSTGKYQLGERVKDDSNNEIGTVSAFFTDANGVEYAVVCLLDVIPSQKYILAQINGVITDLPMYDANKNAWWAKDALETATFNTQKIIDCCTANNKTSPMCDYCRSFSHTIDGVTYYGQLPNMKELFDTFHYMRSSTFTSNTNHELMSSTQDTVQYFWVLTGRGQVTWGKKSETPAIYTTIPILEIPNA